ncbi:glycoside hydrolase family 12 protein [Athelia psychrophila]|uniref:Glycoside hydrolase family 12 protein n=1 Tax=Athelia psychrophila TaxID=1759441 RepID=A0A166DDB5_9AGAM|nr:glycoside hydrolase family 12 protein [Fibularhizoctonia sp. CBS 109695]
MLYIPALFLAGLASASSIQRRASYCGQYQTAAVGTDYTLNTNLWGLTSTTKGSQCSTLLSSNGTDVAWSTTWQWSTGGGVKSFSNINLEVGIDVQLSAITSIPTTWDWSISSSSGIIADVAYDFFTSSTAGGRNEYEIMIWLVNYNAGPLSYNYGSSGAPTPVVSNISLSGYTWDLYYGTNGANYVYSFLPVSGAYTAFSGDLKAFFTASAPLYILTHHRISQPPFQQYLTNYQTLAASQYLVTAQGGTEPTSSNSSITLTT